MSDLSRLKSQLAVSGLQQQNAALYQVISQLIDSASSQVDGLTNVVNVVTTSSAPKTATYLTANDEHGDLPQSRQLLPGTSVSFDDTVPNKRTVNVAPTTPGGVSGDVQYNNAGAFAGSNLKQLLTDVIAQLRGVNAQELRIYEFKSGSDEQYLSLAQVLGDFFAEAAYTIESQTAGAGADQGIQLKTTRSISLQIPGAFPVLMLYHDPTSNGGISLIPNGSGFIGTIFCDQSGSLMQTPGGFGVPHMIDLLIGSNKSLIIGHTVAGADFTIRFMTFNDAIDVVQIGGKNSSPGIGFVFDQAFNGLVANLPAAPPLSTVMYVTNALAPAMGAIVAGGGAAFALVCWNGANWRVIGV